MHDVVEEAEEPFDATEDMQVIEQAHSAEVPRFKERIKKLTYSLKSAKAEKSSFFAAT